MFPTCALFDKIDENYLSLENQMLGSNFHNFYHISSFWKDQNQTIQNNLINFGRLKIEN